MKIFIEAPNTHRHTVIRLRQWLKEWEAYQRANKRANSRYRLDRDTIDHRYDPTNAR